MTDACQTPPAKSFWSELLRAPLGLVTLELLLIQLVTGPLLALSYRPGLPNGYQAVLEITREAPMGWLIRGVHRYTAYALVVSALLHLFAVYFKKSYRGQAIRGWLLGNLFLFFLIGSTFTGLLLPLDIVSACATRVALSLLAALPGVGAPLARLFFGYTLGGDFDPFSFHVVHIAILPPALLLMIWFHRLHRGGLNEKLSRPTMLGIGALLALVILLIAAFNPPPLSEAFDPLREVKNNVHPAWIFMSAYLLLGYTSSPIWAIALLLGLLLIWLLIPFLSRGFPAKWGQRIIFWWGLLMAAAFVLGTILAYPLTSVK